MKEFFSYLNWLFFGRPVKQALRTKTLQSLRIYVKLVGGVRKASMMAVLGVMGLSAITVGFFMLIGGLLWLANLNPEAYPWIMVGVGAILTIAGVAGYIFAFRQKLWVEMSRVHEFTQAAVAKYPVTERPGNPAVTAMWAMAAEARIREHSRLENQVNQVGSISPTVENPLTGARVVTTPTPVREIEPTLQPV